jgi:hypothetical protein
MKEEEMKAALRILGSGVFFAMLLAGCAALSSPTATPTSPPPAPTDTPAPPTPTPEPSPTPTQPYTPIEAQVNVFSLNLRAGPGTLFKSGGYYNVGAKVTVLGKAPGGQWVKVKTFDNKDGWMFADFLDLKDKITEVPVVPVGDAIVIEGKAADVAGNGIRGINVAITQQSGSQTLRVDAISGADGTFYAYLPTTSSGTWSAEIVGVDCSSPIIEGNCKYSGTFDPSGKVTIDLGQLKPILFTYKK